MKHAEREQRHHRMKEEAWEHFKRQPSLRPRTREEFEEACRRKVVWSSSSEEQEKDLQKWLNELQEVADLEERGQGGEKNCQ